MRSSSLSKTSYPNFSKTNNSHGVEYNFKDDNLRDPALNYQGSMNDDISLNSVRQPSEVFDQGPRSSNFDKGTLDLKQTQGFSGNKTQTAFVSKSKRLQPIKSNNLPTTLQHASATLLKGNDYGVSDFYLKNFLGKQRIETEGRRIASHGTGNFFETAGNGITVRSSTLDNRKAGKSPGRHMSQELLQIANGQGPRQKFYDSLAVSYKEFYMDKKEFMKIFDDIDVAMYCHEEVSYR